MHFGATLEQSIHPPWREHYVDYTKLKHLLREDVAPDSAAAQAPWTENDESAFVEELINVQLEKVHAFQRKKYNELQDRTSACEARLEEVVRQEEDTPQKDSEMKKCLKELDGITEDIEELERFARINFTGFLKAAKKHDRKERGGAGKGKGKEIRQDPKVRPILQVRLAQLEFNKEDYSPLLYRLSTMYDFIRQNLSDEQPTAATEGAQARRASISVGPKRYSSHKFWVHPDNILEVKTFILRRLPVLVYNSQPSKNIDNVGRDPTITSLYFDNSKFSLYNDKVSKKPDAKSLRLRWYGDLKENNEVFLERKTIRSAADDTEGASEERIPIKTKYVNDFISGKYSMEKQIQKMKDRAPDDVADKYSSLVDNLQKFIQEQDLEPCLRACYTRTAFQIPGDDRIRISLDTNLALIREDTLDSQRPCREPDDWHRHDIDDSGMAYPFSTLRKGEISRFPYALLEINIRDSELRSRTKSWIHDLMSSHLVHAAPRFSKFVHGVAVLFDDHVNTFPFWLGEMEEDIRKDPKAAWDAEQKRIQKQQDDETHVGSLRAQVSSFGGRSGSSGGGGGSHRSSTAFPSTSPQGRGTAKILPSIAAHTTTSVTEAPEAPETAESPLDAAGPEAYKKPLENFRHLFPSFNLSRYGRAHSSNSRRRSIPSLPPGVTKPSQLLMHQGPVRVEAKVWLANQRTFIKWMHITVLLASLAIALFNSTHAKMAAGIYTGIAVFAGVWGWGVFMWRSKKIEERSASSFDATLGPIVVCVALAVGLVVQFVVRYRQVTAGGGGNGGGDGPVMTVIPGTGGSSVLPPIVFDGVEWIEL
ncbi:SPX-domain-containing protein [Ascodesmis nigricans]|uniref:SPX-domain-containing protein n=1 Tax=Ascodesmis nigricans TaxID=341454 RepID=A0A4S2MHJ0_9PEZI|nr:SPX-domain-containing protein [Ascodesmis nigricans]